MSASSIRITLCFAFEVRDTVDAYTLHELRTVSRNLPSSDPFITSISVSNSLHNAFATVVLPTPAPPLKSRLGISPCLRNPSNTFLVESGKIHSLIVFGRYCSTQRNSLSDIVV